MTEERNQLAEQFAACWKDEALKARFFCRRERVRKHSLRFCRRSLSGRIVNCCSGTLVSRGAY